MAALLAAAEDYDAGAAALPIDSEDYLRGWYLAESISTSSDSGGDT
eukprot:SAG22_NODE_11629_length_476_cov_0.832891_1_plen_45_part_01